MHEVVQEYYGQQLTGTQDLKTSVCCDATLIPDWVKPLLANIHEEVLSRYYGCGLVCPPMLKGCRVLDLGCGSGRDVYALSQLVGPEGEVVGVDMTDEQLEVAERHHEYHAQKFGFDNVRFIHGYIEKLEQLGLEPESFDVIVSNCVINLSPDKPAVMRGIHHLLKPGGEFYFSDVYADRRVPAAVKNDPVLYGECLGGALYWKDFERLSHLSGFADPRLVEDRPLEITDPDLERHVSPVRFFSATYRLFKVQELETACEDYGQAVTYKGDIQFAPDRFVLDKHHKFETGEVFPVSGNTWKILAESRFAPHFEFIGDFSCHYGIFEGDGSSLPFATTPSQSNSNACC